ncbi:MAG: HAD-IIB family hydrolase [Lachnospiraceae bacterium]|nr:HAD-IIB family hydrolase [Lachnospiraceae bacterium]
MSMRVENQSKWKAIILDLDGTLLHSDGSVSEYTLKTLQECKKRGIVIAVATARFWFKAEKYLNMISPDYAILADGTQIYHNGEMIYGCAMDEMQSDGIINELLQKNTGNEFVASTGKKLFCSAEGIDEEWRVSRDFTEPLNCPAYKIAAILNTCEEAKILAEKYDCRLYSYRGEDLYGFVSRKSGKYQAVLALGEILHINLNEMIAFGDDENDYEILQNVGNGVAVANAILKIREIADDITESNNDDGVAKYIENELGIYGDI